MQSNNINSFVNFPSFEDFITKLLILNASIEQNNTDFILKYNINPFEIAHLKNVLDCIKSLLDEYRLYVITPEKRIAYTPNSKITYSKYVIHNCPYIYNKCYTKGVFQITYKLRKELTHINQFQYNEYMQRIINIYPNIKTFDLMLLNKFSKHISKIKTFL